MTEAAATPAMTARELSSLAIGEVVASTGVLESHPAYRVEAGARFVVVSNTLSRSRHGVLGLRLAPADAALLTAGDLSEWCGAVEVHDPVSQGDDGRASGADPADGGGPGDAWSRATAPVRRAPDALPLADRVAAVFTQRLFEDVDREGLREAARRNAAEADPKVCHSHDLCDANMPMLAAFEAMGLSTPIDAVDDASLGDGPSTLWEAAWTLAKADWPAVAGASEADGGDGTT